MQYVKTTNFSTVIELFSGEVEKIEHVNPQNIIKLNDSLKNLGNPIDKL
jgi:hypothetical protein